MMIIHLIIRKNEKARIQLYDNKTFIDETSWQDKANFSRNLLKKIDELLRKNIISIDPEPILKKNSNKKTSKRKTASPRGISKSELRSKNWYGAGKITGYKIISDVPESWTTYRIAKITLESLMIGLAKKNKL